MSSGTAEPGALAGLRVAVTRPTHAVDELSSMLEARGARPLRIPLIRTAPPADRAPLRAALEQLERYDWIVFTSANAVHALAGELTRYPPPRASIAAVGPATARAVHQHLGRRPDVIPEHFAGQALAAAIGEQGSLAGRRILWPRAELARDALPQELAAAGARLDAPVAYRTVPIPAAAQRLHELIAGGKLDVVTLASPSAASSLLSGGLPSAPVVWAVIGPATADVVRRHGLRVHVEPEEHTIPALVDELVRYHRIVARQAETRSRSENE